MKHQSGNFTGAKGLSIFYQYWCPEGEIAAVLLLVHGAGEHSDRYRHLADFFNARGYAVAALDHAGHGKSEGVPGYIERFDDYLETLGLFELRVSADFPGAPKVLLGHSLGGLISSLYLLEQQRHFVGCVLSGAAIKTEIEPGLLQMWLIKFLSRWFPKAGVLQLDPQGVSRDPQVVEDYINDPLVHHGKMSARKVAELFSGMERLQENTSKIDLPLLVLHGGSDTMTAPEGSRFLYDRAASADKALKIYPELFHEIFNEPEREQVLGDVLEWCDRIVRRQPEQGA